MNPITPHTHNGTDSPQLSMQDAFVNVPISTVTPVSGTAGGTYTGTEQAIINSLTTTVNELITKLETLGLLR